MAKEPVVRRMSIKIEVQHWEWTRSSSRATQIYDFTSLAISYNWQKSIKTPMGGCTINFLPQLADKSLIELIDPLDIVRISEFGTVKFVGYVRKVSFTGTMSPDGKPTRVVSLTATAMGGIFQEAQLGLNLFLLQKNLDYQNAATSMSTAIADSCKSTSNKIGVIIKAIIDQWLSFVGKVSVTTAYPSWFSQHIDYSAGLQNTDVPGLPREFRAFTGAEESLTLWQMLQKFGEVPFYEMWFDNGPRKVSINGSDVTFTDDKTYLIIRPTPFNGTVKSGSVGTAFDSLPLKTVPLTHLTKYDLNKSMEEVYSFYIVHPSVFDLQERYLVASGLASKDDDKIAKYLYKPLQMQLFYMRLGDPAKNAGLVPEGAQDLYDNTKDAADSLKNWFSKSDVHLSGAILMMVPKTPENDILIGDKIEIEGIKGSFYVESVAHSWKYQGTLTSNLNITRGLDGENQIDLANKIFKTMKQGKIGGGL
jgi:hypothetical protein